MVLVSKYCAVFFSCSGISANVIAALRCMDQGVYRKVFFFSLSPSQKHIPILIFILNPLLLCMYSLSICFVNFVDIDSSTGFQSLKSQLLSPS